ncbi:MAG: hypothetical protein C0458_04440 [Methylobacterium sp.]|nr:hypothetical protein [Methylobacterium sp.]
MSATTTAATRQSEPSLARRMADFITSHVASAGNVTREDLLLDFTEEQITTHFETAKAIARNGVPAAEQIARRNGKARR